MFLQGLKMFQGGSSGNLSKYRDHPRTQKQGSVGLGQQQLEVPFLDISGSVGVQVAWGGPAVLSTCS